jgi:hypothetical protein
MTKMTKTTKMTKDLKAAAIPVTHAHRTGQMVQDTAKLALTSPHPLAFAGAAALGRAAMERVSVLQKGWVRDWMEWAAYAQSITGADTLPKFAEHAGNIVVRAQAQVTNQMTAITDVSENFAVNYSYWVARQLEERGIDRD